ncbi:MAG TPA: class I SAM-dependent methyltransferase [Pyrinomonadaceae bacterium]|jgi:SAM-dependent methyltransferase
MLNWYRSQLKEHGAWAATRLLSQVVLSRGRTALVNRLLPQKVECPCCGWTGRRFYDYIEIDFTGRNAECPRCNSHARHRALYLWLKNDFQLHERSGVALVFAPERALEEAWNQSGSLKLIRADLEAARGVDVLADLQRLPFASDSIDLLWCHHVLQLVQDDRAAMRELHRVLRPGTGRLIVSVAIARQTETEEYDAAQKRVMNFWRMYGEDFAQRLREAGFEAHEVKHRLSPEECSRYSIDSSESFYLCVKPAYS